MATAVVTLCDAAYWHKARTTILDIRRVGEWRGDLVLIAVDFEPPADFCAAYGLQVVHFPRIPTESLLAAFRANPFTRPTHDRREFAKVTQWEKLHVFEPWFVERWERILFFDAGIRLFGPLDPFLGLNWRGKFLAQDDCLINCCNCFGDQLELAANPEAAIAFCNEFGGDVLKRRYFLNCAWIHDTRAVAAATGGTGVAEFVEMMNRYPIWRTNEMGPMNAVLHFRHGLWEPFPQIAPDGRFLLDWSEANHPGSTWRHFYALKYAIAPPLPPLDATARPPRIGLAIPCYRPHIPKLQALLDSLEGQVRKPDLVAVSCSSTPFELFPMETWSRRYSFPVRFLLEPERLNAAQNRNRAAAVLVEAGMDLLSFFDADDIPHPERLAAVAQAFGGSLGAIAPEIVMHAYIDGHSPASAEPFQRNLGSWTIETGCLARAPSGCVIHTRRPSAIPHHSQLTVRAGIWVAGARFLEGEAFERREDAVFCGTVVEAVGPAKTAFIADPMSKYYMEGSWQNVPTL
jgi:hypothetical protein